MNYLRTTPIMKTKITVETNPTRFLDAAFNINPDGSMTTKVF